MKIEYVPLLNIAQSPPLYAAHLEVEIRFFAAVGRYRTLSSLITSIPPSSSVIVNWMIPIPNAGELPVIPLIPTLCSGLILPTNRLKIENIW